MLTPIATRSEQTLEQIVADTLSFEDYAEWTAIRQSFQAKETQTKEQFLSCIEKGTNKKTCVDPHWCLYPNKLNNDECVWYRIKYEFN